MATTNRAARLLFADEQGRVYDHPFLLAAARDGDAPAGATLASSAVGAPRPLPAHATLAALPGRRPLGIDPRSGQVVEVEEVMFGRRTIRARAVAAVLPPGWTRLALPAFRRAPIAPILPQWAYTAAGWEDGEGPVVCALRTDRRRHWDPADHPAPDLGERVRARLAQEPDNPLLRQLSRCALAARCFTAQNTFSGRDEGAIPASVGCNARCVGCISDQPEEGPPASHQRMDAPPSAEAMADIGSAHLARASGRAMVSFGQGCEGEPLTRARSIAAAIRGIRARTRRGSINVNTNGSLPEALSQLVDAGLDACRISLNSAHPPLYEAYYRPAGYGFAQVESSVRLAKERGVYTALNLLTFPGVTDREGEIEALCRLVTSAQVDQVQLRSLALDPEQYESVARGRHAGGRALGMRELFRQLVRARPGLVLGNFARGLRERTSPAPLQRSQWKLVPKSRLTP